MTRLFIVVLLVALAACSAPAKPPEAPMPRCVVSGSGDVQAQVCACFETEDGIECPEPAVLQGIE